MWQIHSGLHMPAYFSTITYTVITMCVFVCVYRWCGLGHMPWGVELTDVLSWKELKMLMRMLFSLSVTMDLGQSVNIMVSYYQFLCLPFPAVATLPMSLPTPLVPHPVKPVPTHTSTVPTTSAVSEEYM